MTQEHDCGCSRHPFPMKQEVDETGKVFHSVVTNDAECVHKANNVENADTVHEACNVAHADSVENAASVVMDVKVDENLYAIGGNPVEAKGIVNGIQNGEVDTSDKSSVKVQLYSDSIDTAGVKAVQGSAIKTALAGKISKDKITDRISGGNTMVPYSTTVYSAITEGKVGYSNTENAYASNIDTAGVKAVQGSAIKTALAGKVDKETGKGLSTNDFTNAEKTKLASLSSVMQLKGSMTAIDISGLTDKSAGDVYIVAGVGGTITPGGITVVIGDIVCFDGTNWVQLEMSVHFDDTVTQSSSNGVKSSGIYAALQAKLDASKVKTAQSTDAGDVYGCAYINSQLDAKQDSLEITDCLELMEDSIATGAGVIEGVTTGEYYTDSTHTETGDLYADDVVENSKQAVQGGVLYTKLACKVDKMSGYSLTKNDFTDAYKAKLNGIKSGANGTFKGYSSVSDVNSATPFGGDVYILSDSGTISMGSLAVISGDAIIYDGSSNVWRLLATKSQLIQDEAPTAGSGNNVKSGGVYTAINTVDVKAGTKMEFKGSDTAANIRQKSASVNDVWYVTTGDDGISPFMHAGDIVLRVVENNTEKWKVLACAYTDSEVRGGSTYAVMSTAVYTALMTGAINSGGGSTDNAFDSTLDSTSSVKAAQAGAVVTKLATKVDAESGKVLMPVLPSDKADGTYVLKCTRTSTGDTYEWVAES